MKTWLKVLIVTLVAIPAIPLGQIIWPSPPGGMEPSAAQLPFFIVLGIVEAVVLGLGVSFVAFGWPLVRNVAGNSRGRAIASYLSIAWLMISWWPHDALHRSNPESDMTRLLFIEYGFHITLMLTAVVLAYSYISLLRSGLLANDSAQVEGRINTAQVRTDAGTV